MKVILFFMVLFPLVWLGCKHVNQPNPTQEQNISPDLAKDSTSTKLAGTESTNVQRPENIEPALWQQVSKLVMENHGATLVKLSGKVSGLDQANLRAIVESLDGKIGTVTDTIFTGEIPANKIDELAKASGIKYLELSKISTIKPQ